jgi:hypothetical protein
MKPLPALAGTLTAMTVLLTACSSTPDHTVTVSAPGTPAGSAPASGSPSVSVPATSARNARVFGRVFDHPDVTVTGGRVYVTWQVNPVTAAVPQIELTRIDQATGAIKAMRLLAAGQAGTPLAVGGWLWLPVVTPSGLSLLRLNPVDLAQTADLSVPGGSGLSPVRGSHLAVADGLLWVADGGRLLRVSPITGQLISSISLPGAVTSDVAANKNGTVLVVSEANDGGLGSVQRRNPVTGTVIASSTLTGVAAPSLGGLVQSGVWVAEATGMLGYIERFDLATMAADPATRVGGTNGISVTVAAGLAWVTDGANPKHDYCADPVTGRALAQIQLPAPGQDSLLACSARYLYYQSPAGHGFYLMRMSVPAACQSLRPVVFTSALFSEISGGSRGERRPARRDRHGLRHGGQGGGPSRADATAPGLFRLPVQPGRPVPADPAGRVQADLARRVDQHLLRAPAAR